MLDGYLIDTQTLCYWIDSLDPRFSRISATIDSLPADAPLYMSTITLGEIRYGQQLDPSGVGPRRAAFEKSIQDLLPRFLEITRHTAEPYGRIRASLANRFAPKEGWNKKRRAEQMTDPLTGMYLGIDENDLWIVAQAVERRLVLVTADKMTRIRDAVRELFPDFQTENWTL